MGWFIFIVFVGIVICLIVKWNNSPERKEKKARSEAFWREEYRKHNARTYSPYIAGNCATYVALLVGSRAFDDRL